MILAVELFAAIVLEAMPFAITFAIGQMLVNTFMNMAFGGKIKFN